MQQRAEGEGYNPPTRAYRICLSGAASAGPESKSFVIMLSVIFRFAAAKVQKIRIREKRIQHFFLAKHKKSSGKGGKGLPADPIS